jgi:ATP-dependent DNA helicase RecG
MLHTQKVDALKGIGAGYASRLFEQGIVTVRDLLMYAPFRYEDLQQRAYANKFEFDKLQMFCGSVRKLTPIKSKKGKIACKGIFEDEFGGMPVVWFNSAYVLNFFKNRECVVLVGKVSLFGGVPTLLSPSYYDLATESPHYGRIVPIYHEFQGVTSKWLRAKIWEILQSQNGSGMNGVIPDKYFSGQDLPNFYLAVKNLHFPKSEADLASATNRLALDELVYVMLQNLVQRRSYRASELAVFGGDITNTELDDFINNLPFRLSKSQIEVLRIIERDFRLGNVNRLLVGDVGSGKTVVAAGLMYLTIKNGFQAVIMAPTQILAAQHAKAIQELLAFWGFGTVLVSGESKAEVLNANVIVGTQALLYRALDESRVGAVIVDEQHRFGVLQREELRTKFGQKLHFLSMTATPIPRTLSLVGMGHLDVSYIERRTDGRKAAKTILVPLEKRERAYQWLREKIKIEGGQLFVVCPFISPSETLESVQAASSVYEYLKNTTFADLRIELLHGDMNAEKKEKVLIAFSQEEFDVLVTTPVVEVGIDIPQARYIVIESADRFGLAQLHQLRGRVGRRGQECFCLLLPSVKNQESNLRLKKMVELDDGYELAKFDLQNRGSGTIESVEQHGFRQFRFADITNEEFVNHAKRIAESIDSEILKGGEAELLTKILEGSGWARH